MSQIEKRRARLHACALSLSFGLVLSGGITHAAEIDSDGDGLSDEQEISLGLDPHSVDSNMDGISDLDASRAMRTGAVSKMLVRAASAAGGLPDADGDGIANFLETYGYYALDLSLHGVKRIVPDAAWDEFAGRGPVLGYPVFQLAAGALTSNQLAQEDTGLGARIVDVAAAHQTIEAAFLGAGISQYSALITGTTAQVGSIASIMAFLVTSHDYQVPTDGSGNALPVYFTNPLRVSTDDDPYTDYDEALGLFNGGRPSTPADHPLVAALPSIRARLVSYRLTAIDTTSTTVGATETYSQMERNTTSRSQSHGVSVSVSREVGLGPTGGVKWEGGISQSNNWSVGSSVTIEEGNSHATFEQNANTTSTHCFSKVQLTVDLANVGSALASNIATSLNIYLGDWLWRTVPLTQAGDAVTLAPSQHVERTVLGQGTDASCLTLQETNFLEAGGQIGIETVMGDGTISVYDPDQSLIVQNGSWAVYRTLIESELARIDLDVFTTAGNRVTNSFWVVAAQPGYPGVGLSVGEILGRIYQPFPCADKNLAGVMCFTSAAGDIALTREAAVDFSFYDEAGDLLSRLASYQRYQALAGDDQQPLSKQPAQRTIVTIVQHAYQVPIFSDVKVLSKLETTAAGAALVDHRVRALVSDYYGIRQVDFCFDAAETDCKKMAITLGTAEHPTSGQYEISLGQHAFTGTEHLRASSMSGQQAQLEPTAFFLTLGDGLYDSLDDYVNKLDDKEAAIAQLARLRSNDGGEYRRIIDSGLMVDLDRIEADDSPLQLWRTALAKARSLCSYDVTAGGNAQKLADDVAACLAYLGTDLADAFNRDIPVYNPLKLPLSHVDGTETDWDNQERTDVSSINCQLQPGQFLVGIDLAKSNGDATPTAWLRYVTWDEYSGTLREVRGKSRCGPNTTRDNTFNTPSTEVPYKANLILDVGASMGGSKAGNKSNGQVTRLCVSFRTFNFKTLQFEGNNRIDCDGSSSLKDTEADTSGLGVVNSAQPLSGLIIGGRSNSTFQYMRGMHLKNLSRKYDFKPWHTLVSGGKYRIENSAHQALTVQGGAAASRGLALAASDGLDHQVWTVEAVNDREFRLVPQSYPGFITRNAATATTVSVNAAAADDSINVNFLQHWRLEQLVNGEYLIQSVLDDKKVLTADLNLAAYAEGDARQEWHFVRLDDSRSPPVSVRSLKLALPSNTLRNRDYYCTPILDTRDAALNARYVDRLAVRIDLTPIHKLLTGYGFAYNAGGEIFDDARHLLGSWHFDWPTRPANSDVPSPKTIQVSFPRYVAVKELRFCGRRTDDESSDALLQKVWIEALCKSAPATEGADFGLLQESCQ